MANLMKGLPVARIINQETGEKIEILRNSGIIPKLAIVRVGDKDDDVYYENSAVKRCGTLGIDTELCHLSEGVSQSELEAEIIRLNEDPLIHGVLILRPLPKHIDDGKISRLLAPEKDVDGITPHALYNVFSGQGYGFVPCTAKSCIEILKYYIGDLSGKNAVVIGRSLVIGKPVAMLLLSENATVTICHTKTKNLADITKRADIIITSAGSAGSLTEKHVSSGQFVIDVGMNTDSNGNMCGDADFEKVSDVVDSITPVPGGVGSVTTAVLLNNVVRSAMRDYEKR